MSHQASLFSKIDVKLGCIECPRELGRVGKLQHPFPFDSERLSWRLFMIWWVLCEEKKEKPKKKKKKPQANDDLIRSS